MGDFVLNVEDLAVKIANKKKSVHIIKNVSFKLKPKEILALVGGSGSGKSTTALAIMQLLSPALFISKGSIVYNKTNLLTFTSELMQEIRGKEIGMVFQEPLYAFNPLFRIGHQIEEVLVAHTTMTSANRKERVLDLLNKVGIDDPKRVSRAYPHQLSGGMRQRAMIAQAIAAEPKIIIADEPTSNLDVTLQVRIMDLFRRLRDELDLSIILISHDLGMVSHLADNIIVMKQGGIIEKGTVGEITKHPKQDYTQQLMEAAN